MTETIDLFCPECGYNVRGITSERCPECGQTLDREGMTRSTIPWTHRETIGRWRAYWRTVWLVSRGSKQISHEIQRPVSLGDARKFRRATVWLAAVPLWSFVLLSYVGILAERGGTLGDAIEMTIASATQGPPGALLGWILEWVGILVGFASVFLFLILATDAPSVFFHPSSIPVKHQNRAVALSYYACAPLAWTPITVGLLLIYLLLAWYEVEWLAAPDATVMLGLAIAVVFGSMFVQAIGVWLEPVRLMMRVTHSSGTRAIAMAVLLPIFWMLQFIVIVLGIPAAYVFVSLVVFSFI